MNEKKSKDSSFSGQLGFVLAAAASAVGVRGAFCEVLISRSVNVDLYAIGPVAHDARVAAGQRVDDAACHGQEQERTDE